MSLSEIIHDLVSDVKKTKNRLMALRKLKNIQLGKPVIIFKSLNNTNRCVEFEVNDLDIVNSYINILVIHEEDRLKKLENELAKYEIKIVEYFKKEEL